MNDVQNYIRGGYAYYRYKGFSHSSSISMILLSSLGFILQCYPCCVDFLQAFYGYIVICCFAKNVKNTSLIL